MHKEGERRVQRYAQRRHREKLRGIQKGEMRRTETVTCADSGGRAEGTQRNAQRWHREELRQLKKGVMRRTEREERKVQGDHTDRS
jgi:hypothetical protein